MTPNLTSARQAIQAELSHARQGMAFYSARVEALETALSQLENVDSDEVAPVAKQSRRAGKKAEPKRTGRGRSAGEEGSRRKARASKRTGSDDKLPTTGVDFWLKLVTDEPKSAVEIANAAAEVVGLKPEQREQIQKLKQRVAPALATLVASQKVQDTGTGRERRFFRSSQSA